LSPEGAEVAPEPEGSEVAPEGAEETRRFLQQKTGCDDWRKKGCVRSVAAVVATSGFAVSAPSPSAGPFVFVVSFGAAATDVLVVFFIVEMVDKSVASRSLPNSAAMNAPSRDCVAFSVESLKKYSVIRLNYVMKIEDRD
jgi:hypothetical protein